MKVAFIRFKYDPYGGAERFTQALIDSLVEHGVEVHLFARTWTQPGSINVHLHRIGGPRWPSLLRHASFVYRVGQAVRRQSFDLIQSNERTLCQDVYRAGDGVHARWLELRASQQTLQQRLAVRLNPFHIYMLRLERRLFEHPDLKAIIVNSNMVRQEITARFRVAPACIHTIYNGVDLDRFKPEKKMTVGGELRAAAGLDSQTPVVLFVGSGFERKGLAPLLKGMALAGESAVLWVVGKGDEGPYLRLARALGIQERVRFWGSQRDVAPFYAAADLFALPSIYDPFPTAVLEALASGLPVITTAQCGAAEIINEGEEGFILSSPGNREELADYFGRLSSRELCVVMGSRARELAETFPLSRTIQELEGLYCQLLQAGRPGGWEAAGRALEVTH